MPMNVSATGLQVFCPNFAGRKTIELCHTNIITIITSAALSMTTMVHATAMSIITSMALGGS